MPLVKGKPKQISQRHYFGNSGGLLGSIVNVLSTKTETVSQSLKNGINQMKRKRKLILPERYCTERYVTITDFAPLWVNNTTNTVIYGTQTIQSNDLFILKSDNKYFCKKQGIWRIESFLLNTPSAPGTLGWTDHTLYLYKNGVIYSILDTNTTITSPAIGAPMYDAFDALKGFDFIELNEGDYIEIKYTFTGSIPLGALDYISSRLLITYENKQGETI